MSLDIVRVAAAPELSAPQWDWEPDYLELSEFVKRYVPDYEAQPELGGTCLALAMPWPAGAEYQIKTYVYPDGERQIGASRISAPGPEYFWYVPMELYKGHEADKVREEFFEKLDRLFTYDTRVVQDIGWLLLHFRCEYLDPCQGWQYLGGVSALRLSFMGPKIAGKQAIYRSPALKTARPA